MPQDLSERFRTEAERASSNVFELPDWAAVAAHLRERADGDRVVVSPDLAAGVPEFVAVLERQNVTVHVPDDARDGMAAGVADAAVGVIRGELAVAETGSVLVSEHRLADRTVTMLCRRLVQVVDRDRLVGSLDDIATWLAANLTGAAGFASLMTGPSRTADIERSLTIGVQGPDQVDVVVLG